jgi:outer membrane protein OmpA-like peptidoglycan-associated protein
VVIWIGGTSYAYVCKIRQNCGLENAGIIPVNEIKQPGSINPDSSAMVNVPEKVSTPEKLIVYFDPGKSKCILNQAEQDQIGLIKQYLAARANSRIEVSGHADITGSPAINSQISLQRAEYVKQVLIDSGIQEGSIDIAGKGTLEPLSDNSSAEGRAKNRRVEILIH